MKNIIKDDEEVLRRLNNAVLEMNHIIILTYQFIKLYVLDKYYKEDDIPIIDEAFIILCIKTVASGSNRGPPCKDETLKIKNELEQFYQEEFKLTIEQDKLCFKYSLSSK